MEGREEVALEPRVEGQAEGQVEGQAEADGGDALFAAFAPNSDAQAPEQDADEQQGDEPKDREEAQHKAQAQAQAQAPAPAQGVQPPQEQDAPPFPAPPSFVPAPDHEDDADSNPALPSDPPLESAHAGGSHAGLGRLSALLPSDVTARLRHHRGKLTTLFRLPDQGKADDAGSNSAHGEQYQPFDDSAHGGSDGDGSMGGSSGHSLSSDIASLAARFKKQAEVVHKMEAQAKKQAGLVSAHHSELEAKVRGEAGRVHDLEREVRAVEEEVKEKDRRLRRLVAVSEALRAQQAQLEAQLRRQKFLQFLMMPKTLQYAADGEEVFVWVVDEAARRRRHNEELYSPEFTSSLFHYTFRMKLRWNAPGSLNEGCLSAGLNLRKGPNDAQAVWPFALHFTARVVDMMGCVVESASIQADAEAEDAIAVAFQEPPEGNELSRGWGNFLCWDDHDESQVVVGDRFQVEMVFARPAA